MLPDTPALLTLALLAFLPNYVCFWDLFCPLSNLVSAGFSDIHPGLNQNGVRLTCSVGKSNILFGTPL